jgi:hypothetical protein
MPAVPTIVTRGEQPYMAIRARVTMAELGGLGARFGEVFGWPAGQGLSWDMSPGEAGERWGSRLEIYLTDPSQEPDMSKWQTQLAFKLAD